MGLRGIRPQPTVIKLLKGNPGRRRLNTREPTPAPADATLTPPDSLDAAAKREWARVAPLLLKNGLLTEIDVDALTSYCIEWARYVDATGQVAKLGLVVKAPSGFPIQNPYLSVANKAMARAKSLMQEFGMTPSSRANVSRSGEERPATTLDRFINRSRSK